MKRRENVESAAAAKAAAAQASAKRPQTRMGRELEAVGGDN